MDTGRLRFYFMTATPTPLMKTLHPRLRRLNAGLLCAVAAAACHAAPQTYKEPAYIRWNGKKGNWDDAKNWAGGKVPAGFAVAGVRAAGAAVTLDSPVPDLLSAGFGSTGSGTVLQISKGAKLRVTGSFNIFSNEANSRSAAEMTGGDIEVGVGGETSGLGIGSSLTFSTNAVMTISGGTVIGGITIGSQTGLGGSALLVIKGSDAKIEDNNKRTSLMISKAGTLEFILDEKGVSALDFSKRTVTCISGSKLRVDASAYQVPPQVPSRRIPLILAWRWKDVEVLDMAVTAQPQGATAELVVETPPARQPGIFLHVRKK